MKQRFLLLFAFPFFIYAAEQEVNYSDFFRSLNKTTETFTTTPFDALAQSYVFLDWGPGAHERQQYICPHLVSNTHEYSTLSYTFSQTVTYHPHQTYAQSIPIVEVCCSQTNTKNDGLHPTLESLFVRMIEQSLPIYQIIHTGLRTHPTYQSTAQIAQNLQNLATEEHTYISISARCTMHSFLSVPKHNKELKEALQGKTKLAEQIQASIDYIESLHLPREALCPLLYCLAVDGYSGNFDFHNIDNPLQHASPLSCNLPTTFLDCISSMINLLYEEDLLSEDQQALALKHTLNLSAIRHMINILTNARVQVIVGAENITVGQEKADRLFPVSQTTTYCEQIRAVLNDWKPYLQDHLKESKLVCPFYEPHNPPHMDLLKSAIFEFHKVHTRPERKAVLNAYIGLESLPDGGTNGDALPVLLQADVDLEKTTPLSESTRTLLTTIKAMDSHHPKLALQYDDSHLKQIKRVARLLKDIKSYMMHFINNISLNLDDLLTKDNLETIIRKYAKDVIPE